MRSVSNLLAALFLGFSLIGSAFSGEAEPKPTEKPDAAPKKVPALVDEVANGEDEPQLRRAWKLLTPDQIISDSSILYISTGNFRIAKKAYSRSALAGLLDKRDISRALGKSFVELREAYVLGEGTSSDFKKRRRNRELDVLSKIYEQLDGHVALAFSTPEFNAAKMLSIKDMSFPFLFAMTMNDQAHHKTLTGIIDRFSASQLADPKYKDQMVKVGPYKIKSILCADLNLIESWAFVENVFLYGQGKGVVEEAVKAYHVNNGAGTLIKHDGYDKALSKVGGDEASLYLQLDLSAIAKKLAKNPMLSYGLSKAFGLNLNNLNKIRPQVALSMSVADGENAAVLERLLIRTPNTAEASTSSCNAKTTYMAGGDTILFQATQGKLGDFLTFITKGSAQQGSPAWLKWLPKVLPELTQLLQVQNKEQVLEELAPFNGELAYFASYLPGASISTNPGEVFPVIFSLEIAPGSKVKAEATLKKIRASTGLTFKNIKYQGTEIWYQFGAKPEEKKGKVRKMSSYMDKKKRGVDEDNQERPFFVAHAFVELPPLTPTERKRTFLLLSDSLKGIQKALQQARIPNQSLHEQDGFKKLIANFNESRNSMTVANLPLALKAFYRDALPSYYKKIRHNTNLKNELKDSLPKEKSLEDHISSLGWAFTSINQGQLIELVSPTGVIPLAGLMGASSWSWYKKNIRVQMAQKVSNQLKNLSLGLHLYAAVFDRFPEKLSDLYPEYVSSFDAFSSPFANNTVRSKEDINDPVKTNLKYVPGRDLTDLSKDILIYEVQPTRMVGSREKGFRILYQTLMLNGTVRPLPKIRLVRLLAGKTDIIITNVNLK